MNLIKSEWIKLTTTKSVWITSLLILFFSAGFAYLMGMGGGMSLASEEIKKDPMAMASVSHMFTVDNAIGGFTAFGLMMVVIQAAIYVTNEYSNGTAKSTALGSPKRLGVPVAKWLVYGSVVALVTLLATVLSVYTMRWGASMQLDDTSYLDKLSLSADGAWRAIGIAVLVAVLMVGFTVGFGYLLRNTAGTIATILLWRMILEDLIIPQIPKIRDWLPPYLPFKNMSAALSNEPVTDAPWDATGSLFYFIAWVVVIFVVGVITLKKRDA